MKMKNIEVHKNGKITTLIALDKAAERTLNSMPVYTITTMLKRRTDERGRLTAVVYIR